jgi:uncharacterized FlgJ-related protein
MKRILILLFVALCSFTPTHKKKHHKHKKVTHVKQKVVNDTTIVNKKDTVYISYNKVNYHWLYYEICQQGIKYPDIVFAQGVLESGHFTSDKFRDGNNLFGMKLSHYRKTTAIGEKNGHAAYDSWFESVQDYKLWQNTLKPNVLKDRKTYLHYVESRYCECSGYRVQLVDIIKRFKKNFNPHEK